MRQGAQAQFSKEDKTKRRRQLSDPMVRVGTWRKAALVALCQLFMALSDASVSIIERDVEPTLIETSAATSDSSPVWIVLPMLLDVQPLLMKLDVTRHVPAQVQSFCREHGVDVTRCAGAIREALDEVVDFQRFCKNPNADNALPGFAVAKHVLRGDGESASASWLPNDPEDVALDFCDFAQSGGDDLSAANCADKLGAALRLSFDWMLALTPCDQESATSSDEVGLQEIESPNLVERLATVEQMIAELHNPFVEEAEAPAAHETEAAGIPSDENVASVEEISEVEEPAASVADSNGYTGEVVTSTLAITEGSEDIGENYEVVEATQENPEDLHDLTQATASEDSSPTQDLTSDAEERVFEFQACELDTITETALPAGNGSCEATFAALPDEETGEALESQKSWKVGAALVLALSIIYLAIDLMLHLVHCVAGYLGTQKQLINVLLRDILLLVGGPPHSTLKTSEDDDLKKPVKEEPPVSLPAAECSEVTKVQLRSKESKADKSPVSCVAAADAPKKKSSPSPSFACVAMLLMAGRQAPISHDQFSMSLRATTFMQPHNEEMSPREQAAALRIQKAWRTVQRKSSPKQERGSALSALVIPHKKDLGKSHPSTPLFQLLRLRSKKAAQPPRGDKVSAGFHRLVPSTLPPL